MISSDDALFGHPSFRYFGWGPRMWTWVQMMGLRKFQEMVFTGRPFTAAEMYDCNFLNKVVARDQLEAEVEKYALACARNRPVDTVFQQKMFFEIFKQQQGEYMGSLLSAFFESMGGWRGQRRRDDLTCTKRSTAGLADAVNDNDRKFPPEFRLSKSNRQEGRLRPVLPLSGYVVVDLSTGIAGAYCTKLLADGGAEVVKVESPRGRSAAAVVGVGRRRSRRAPTVRCSASSPARSTACVADPETRRRVRSTRC